MGDNFYYEIASFQLKAITEEVMPGKNTKPDWVASNYHFLQGYIGRLLGTLKNPSGVCSLNKEWVRAELSFSRWEISSAHSANTLPFRNCFKTELGWREFGFVHRKVLHFLVKRFKWFPVIFLGFVLIMRLLILGCKTFAKPEKYPAFSYIKFTLSFSKNFVIILISPCFVNLCWCHIFI